MKRISVLALLVCLLASSQSWAWYRSGRTMRYRNHYSTHAFGVNHSGLIPGDSHYSVYDMGLNGNGLISDCVRYSPYAFGTRHNGLINDYSGWSCGWSAQACGANTYAKHDVTKECSPSGKPHYISLPVGHAQNRVSGTLNTRQIVRQHLAQHIPGDFKIKHPFFMNGQFASFDIISAEGDTLIKYWNPEMIEIIKQSKRLSKIYANYLKSSAQRCEQHQQRGGHLYHITTSKATDICVALDKTLGRTPADKTYCKDIRTVPTP